MVKTYPTWCRFSSGLGLGKSVTFEDSLKHYKAAVGQRLLREAKSA
jgi:hypothetical protein